MPLLFSYGSLQEEAVQLSTFGRRLAGSRDELPRCAVCSVPIDDLEVRASTGKTHHANVRFSGAETDRAPGMVFDVTDDELLRVDGYEAVFAYTRVLAPLASGQTAWVYLHQPSRRRSPLRSPVTFDLVTRDDVVGALELSAAEGWSQGAPDWERVLGLEPAGCFAARDGGRLVGTVTTTTYARDLAWIGMMLVHPSWRGQGIGKVLMHRALDYLHGLGIETVNLDATPVGRPLYESLGFRAEAVIERWRGTAPAVSVDAPALAGSARGDEVAVAVALDRTAYGADRSRLIEQLCSDCPGGPLVLRAPDQTPIGFALARSNRTGTYIGPIVAPSREAAVQLLEGMLGRVSGGPVALDLHRGGLLDADAIAARGLTMQRGLTRMSHGAPSAAGMGEGISASAGPPFG